MKKQGKIRAVGIRVNAIYTYATADLNKGGEYYPYQYLPWRHPALEWAEVFKADTLGMGFKVNGLDWNKYELAIVFSHSDSMGSAALIRKLNPKIKIMMIPEPPPEYLLHRIPFQWLPRLVDDFQAANIVGLAHEAYLDDFKARFHTKNIHFTGVPINIEDMQIRMDLSKRKNIVASTTHCNYGEPSRRSWEIIQRAMYSPDMKGYITRCFYAYTLDYLHKLNLMFDEAYNFIWDYAQHIPRMNECKIFVDDNICAASGHMSLEMACLDIPSVGCNDFITHLYPEISYPSVAIHPSPERRKSEVDILAGFVRKLATDESFYKSMVDKGRQQLWDIYSYKACKKRAEALLGIV